MSKRAIKGVLDNFLGTYTSRYSDYNGYWVFGLLFAELAALRIDLLCSIEGMRENTPRETAKKLAAKKFREQMEKAGIPVSYAKEASLSIEKVPGSISGFVNDRRCLGATFRFVARVASRTGFTYERKKAVFVAPHDPQVERRSVR